MKKIRFLLTALLLVVTGCSSTYTLRVVDEQAQEIYLTFSKGAKVQVGDILDVYRTAVVQASGGGHHGGGGENVVKEVVGKVQVVEIVDEQHALVKVLSGRVEDGLRAEKVK